MMYLNVIKLASEEMMVPMAPMLTPWRSAGQWTASVNVERRTAAGTFEMNWLAIRPEKKTEVLVLRKAPMESTMNDI